MRLPPVLAHRNFRLYWLGLVLSQLGTRGALAANLYHVYTLSRSIAYTGLVGVAQVVALLVLSPLGGAFADRFDRRQLLQVAQAAAMVVAGALSWLTLTGQARVVHVVVSVALITAAAALDQPARQALIPALVPAERVGQAFAIMNPSRELAILAGPLLAGVLISLGGPGLMYAVDAATYALLVAALAFVRMPVRRGERKQSLYRSIVDGARHIGRRPLIQGLILLDLSATVFGAYRVLLPAIALDVLRIGPTGYGVLSAAPPAGALLAGYLAYRGVSGRRQGRMLLAATALYGGSAILLANAAVFALAVAAAGLLGACDMVATTIRQTAVQLDTPDEIRGRVTAFYQMASRGGPALGDAVMGTLAGAVGPALALTVGASVPILVAGAFWRGRSAVRDYSGVVPADS